MPSIILNHPQSSSIFGEDEAVLYLEKSMRSTLNCLALNAAILQNC